MSSIQSRKYQPLNDIDLVYLTEHYNHLHDSAIEAWRSDPEHAYFKWNALDSIRHLLYVAEHEGYLEIRWDQGGKGTKLANLTALAR